MLVWLLEASVPFLLHLRSASVSEPTELFVSATWSAAGWPAVTDGL